MIFACEGNAGSIGRLSKLVRRISIFPVKILTNITSLKNNGTFIPNTSDVSHLVKYNSDIGTKPERSEFLLSDSNIPLPSIVPRRTLSATRSCEATQTPLDSTERPTLDYSSPQQPFFKSDCGLWKRGRNLCIFQSGAGSLFDSRPANWKEIRWVTEVNNVEPPAGKGAQGTPCWSVIPSPPEPRGEMREAELGFMLIPYLFHW